MRLYGRRSVLERIKTNPQSIRKIYLQQNSSSPQTLNLLRKNCAHIESISAEHFTKLSRQIPSQGIIAEVNEFRYCDFDEITSLEDKNKPTLVCLDRINDPQNLGSILRTCSGFGNFCVVLPKHESVDITEAVLRVACGGENYTPVCRVTNLSNAVLKAKEEGYWIGATVVEGGQNLGEAKFNFPLGLLFGSEGQGVRPGLLKHIDYELSLPMSVAEFSFNVAVAVGIFCYEVNRQKMGT